MKQHLFPCTRCGAECETWGGQDTTCPSCGQMHNCFGQAVMYALEDIDYLDAGERWDDD